MYAPGAGSSDFDQHRGFPRERKLAGNRFAGDQVDGASAAGNVELHPAGGTVEVHEIDQLSVPIAWEFGASMLDQFKFNGRTMKIGSCNVLSRCR